MPRRPAPLRFVPALVAPAVVAPAVVALLVAPALAAQSFGDQLRRTAERAAKSEVQRKVDQETREITRCVLGDARCEREARRQGREVEYVDERGRPVAASATMSDDPRADHPLVSPYAGSEWIEGTNRAFDGYTRIVGRERGEYRTESHEGRVTRRVYRNPGGRSTLEIVRNYRQALEARGLRVDWACDGRDGCGNRFKPVNGMNTGVGGDLRYFTGALRNTDGGTAFISIAVNPQRSFLDIVETAAMDTGMVSAEGLGAALDADGQVVLEGLYFASGSAELLPESDAAIAAAAGLLAARPELRLEVQGHTDNVGNEAANLTLSRRRAQAVADALVNGHGIASSRLGVRGFGQSQPVADNRTEAGRAQNRRVELVRR